MNTANKETANRWQSADGKFAVRLIHLTGGMRYWAFEIHTGDDELVGLAPNGYGSMDEAKAAIAALACTVCLLVACTCEEALAERVAEASRRDEWAAEASQGERAQLAWAGGV